jgi:hypothetical protein
MQPDWNVISLRPNEREKQILQRLCTKYNVDSPGQAIRYFLTECSRWRILEVGDQPDRQPLSDVRRAASPSRSITPSPPLESSQKPPVTDQVASLLQHIDSYKLAVKALSATVEQLLREQVSLQLQLQQLEQEASVPLSSWPYDIRSTMNPYSRTSTSDLFDQISNGLAKISRIRNAMNGFQ